MTSLVKAAPGPLLNREMVVHLAQDQGIDGKAAVDTLVALYERGFVTYPYTRSCTLPSAEREAVPATLAAVAELCPDLSVAGSVRDDGELFLEHFLEPHHAIVPCSKNTLWTKQVADVGPHAEAVYRLVACQYLHAVLAQPLPQEALS